MPKQRITKIDAGSEHKLSRKTSTVGGTIIADYLNPLDGHRILVVERLAVPAKATKKRTPRTTGTNTVTAPVGVAS